MANVNLQQRAAQAPGVARWQARLRRALVAVSLANICFISAWQRRLYGESFFSPSWSWVEIVTLLCNVLLLGAVFYVLLVLGSRVKLAGHKLEGLVYSIPLFPIANVVRRIAFPYHGRVAAGIMLVFPLAVGFAAVLFRRKLLPAYEFIFLGLAILLPLNLFRLAGVASHYHKPPALSGRFVPEGRAGPRIVWMLFDEMDFDLSFPDRPAGFKLPEFDNLRAHAFFATAAHQPASDTLKAVPAIISGGDIFGIPQEQGDHTLRVQFTEDGPLQDWATAPNLFADARAAHVNVGIVGWYFPYCRMFAKLITDCYWKPIYSNVTDTPAVGRSLVDELDAVTPLESRMRLIQRLDHMLVAAESMSANPQLGLVFIHFPVPHAPEIFDRYSGRVTPYALHKDWFFDNLLIADRSLGMIRSSMQKAGLWDNSVIIVTSDHSLRESMMPHPYPVPLVPFLVKMPAQSRAVVFHQPFTTEIIRPLIRDILAGKVTAANLAGWMQQHAH